MSGKPPLPSTWREEGARHPKDGRRFFEIMRTASRRWIYSWSPRSRFGCCMDFWSWGILAEFVAWRYRASERPMGCASNLRSIWLEQAPQSIVRDRDGVYREVFIRRVRSMGIRDRPTHHDRHGRTDMLKGSSVRSDGIALTMSLSSASGIFVTCWYLTKNIK